VTLLADASPEPDETFTLVLEGLANIASKRTGVCLITEAHVDDVRFAGDDSILTFHTVAGRRYAVESSPDLIQWSAVPGGEDIAGAGGAMTLRDVGAAASGARFYRTRLHVP
jgi:hypothetical protein